jgi:hypothetical protein
MKKILLSIILCTSGLLFSEIKENGSLLEMKVYDVENVHYFEDSDVGAFFELNDGSKWFRTYWEGPVYNLEKGQKVAIIPMTPEEAVLHQTSFRAHPHWIILNPKEDSSLVGIAFMMDNVDLLFLGDEPVL